MYRLDGAFEPWIDILLEAILRLFPIPGTIPIGSTSRLPPPRVILNSLEGEVDLSLLCPSGSLSVTLNKNDRITAQDWNQDVRHIELESQQDIVYALSFTCLDAAYFKVAIFLEILLSSILSQIQMRFKSSLSQSVGTKWQMNPCQSERNLKVRPIITRILFLVESCTADQSLPTSLLDTFTLRTLLTYYLDFNAVPRRTFFQYLENFTSDDLEKERLGEFLSKEGAVSRLLSLIDSVLNMLRMNYMIIVTA